jgi:hypothetical protein
MTTDSLGARWWGGAIAVLAVLLPTNLAACKDQATLSASNASHDVAFLADLADKDVGELERGMPEGAKRLGALYAQGADPKQDIAGVRRALQKVRRDVMDLNVAKSTFFALADANGVAIRNDLEEDVMAGQNLVTIFPDLAKARTGAYVTTTGAFPGTGAKGGPDKDWIAAVGVKKDDGTVGGLFVTGWSYRFFARHLEQALKTELTDQAKKAGTEGKLPIFYVAVFDKSGVYSAPLTPDVDEKAMAQADLVAKTSSGAFQGTTTITDRAFGYAARRVPKLGEDTGIVVLRSEI